MPSVGFRLRLGMLVLVLVVVTVRGARGEPSGDGAADGHADEPGSCAIAASPDPLSGSGRGGRQGRAGPWLLVLLVLLVGLARPRKRNDRGWLRAHAGPLGTRRMEAALERIAFEIGRESGDLAVTKVAKRRDPFHVLVACIISLRTRDEITDDVAPRLLAEAPTPRALARLPEARIARRIYPAGFYRSKARTLRALARRLVDEYQSRVPDELDELLGFKGVGRKTANLVLTLGFGKAGICVDTHVHRISNRLGYVRTATPDETERVLRARLPARWWIPVNDLLVSFGRTVCTPLSPRCSQCGAAPVCLRVGVTRQR